MYHGTVINPILWYYAHERCGYKETEALFKSSLSKYWELRDLKCGYVVQFKAQIVAKTMLDQLMRNVYHSLTRRVVCKTYAGV